MSIFKIKGSSPVKMLNIWMKRSKSRNELRRLSDYHLKDIGLTRFDIHDEIRKPFWKE